ncbi:OmpA family protein [Roseomonas rosea]|uniref:OmpA family protein n=1 Tax=Muricoccus roseus TaxID=198092 RepID=A0A1M6DFM2_9PROT|nr:OmpA family protein [Roseomonas rosea]SHI72134.1 OmpA family protein [Roseomonas rosea]
MSPLRAAALLLAFSTGTALAQAPGRPAPPFNCVGAEELEDDVFAIPFAAGRDRLTDAARSNLDAAIALLKREPDRNACILGHAQREGGQQTSVQLAARRARAVREALRAAGLPESRLRSEARVAGFSRTTNNTVARSVSIVVMPVAAPRPEPVPPARQTTPPPPPATPPAGAPPRETTRPPAAPPAEAPPRETAPPPATPPAEPPPRETTRPPAAPPAEAPPRETTPPPAPPPAEAPPRETTRAPGEPPAREAPAEAPPARRPD